MSNLKIREIRVIKVISRSDSSQYRPRDHCTNKEEITITTQHVHEENFSHNFHYLMYMHNTITGNNTQFSPVLEIGSYLLTTALDNTGIVENDNYTHILAHVYIPVSVKVCALLSRVFE